MSSCRSVVTAALSLVFVACGDGGGFPDAPGPDAPPPKGTFTLAWTVTDTNGQTVSCDQIGAQTVTAVLRNPAVQGGFTEVFSCGSAMAMSPGVDPGMYQIDFELNGPSGVIQTAPRQEVQIQGNQNTELMPLAFAVDATGDLALSLSAIGTTTGNCTAPPDGAGITSLTLALEKTSDLSCATVTFDISAGASGGTAQTYTVNCTAPVATANCLHADQVLTATNIPSGGYRVRVRGTSGSDCYVNEDTFSVPALGMTLTRTLNLIKQNGMCP